MMKYFKHSEFDQKGLPGSGKEHMGRCFLSKLDKLRGLCGFPFHINSGYRSAEYNKSIGGTPKSYHVKGRAADVRYTTLKEMVKIVSKAESCGLYGIGVSYNEKTGTGFVHVDDRPEDKRAIWSY